MVIRLVIEVVSKFAQPVFFVSGKFFTKLSKPRLCISVCQVVHISLVKHFLRIENKVLSYCYNLRKGMQLQVSSPGTKREKNVDGSYTIHKRRSRC